jgi:uncharacterized membrane protein
MVIRKLNPKKFFTEEEKNRIVRAIQKAEDKTSGEIRIYLERKAKSNITQRAQKVFEKLGMMRTKDRNGVLVYFSLQSHDFAILGDRGIHEQVGNDFWKATVSKMKSSFAKDDFVEGLENGIREIGEKLKKYFPRQSDDTNELSDEVSSDLP